MNLSSLLLLTTLLHVVISSSEYGVWPLVTPLLNVSAPCLTASREYKATLETISPGDITGRLTPTQRDALRMLDSNGPLPFSQEGMWQDSVPYDLCGFLTSLLPDVSPEVCRIVPDNIRYVMIPSGNAAGPGLETECRKVPDTKYCHNLFQIESQAGAASADQDKHHQQAGFNLNPFTLQDSSSFFDHLMRFPHDAIKKSDILKNDSNTANSPVLEMFLDKNVHAKRMQSSMERILAELDLSLSVDIPKLPLGLYVFFWWQTNLLNGPGYPSGGHQPPFPYRGACYPSACSNQDIRDNNAEFAKQYFQVETEKNGEKKHFLIVHCSGSSCICLHRSPAV